VLQTIHTERNKNYKGGAASVTSSVSFADLRMLQEEKMKGK
jgi:hypothetical protein